jgi:KDO2-lipid IV(A) lauroyltransferase
MNFLVYLVFLFLEKLIPLFSLSFLHFVTRVKGYLFYYMLPIRKKTAYRNLKLAFPEKPEKEISKIIKGCYINVLTVIAEFFYMKKFRNEDLLRMMKVSNPELINEKLKQGKGLILISAHYGNWELTAYGVSRMCGKPFNVIIKEQANKKINERINRIRAGKGNIMIDMRDSLRQVLILLKENKIVAMLGDQSAPAENVKINFFADNVPAFEGAARFALKTGSAVLFGVSLRNKDNTYSLRLHEIDAGKYKDSSEESVRALTQEHFNLLMEYIRKRPDHWLWFHRRFKHTINYD